MEKTFISIGTNQGDRAEHVRMGLEYIVGLGRIMAVSPIYETTAWGFEADDFFNLVIELDTALGPKELLDKLKEIEERMGRRRTTTDGSYSSRVIDFDILSYGDREIDEPSLRIPHPRVRERRFVLQPWNDIAPLLFISSYDATVRDLMMRCTDKTECRLLDHV